MSKQRFLDKLLDGAEVAWLPLGEIVETITAPAKLKKEAYRETGAVPIIDQGASFIAGYTDKDVKALPAHEYVIFGDHSEHIKYVDFSFIQGADGLKILKPRVDNARYVYHAFQGFYNRESNYKRHWSKAKDTLIPLPPLKVQKEIVRILDTFTQLTTQLIAELTTELTLRKKQYNYYREKLLSFDKGAVEWKRLGDALVRTKGTKITAGRMKELHKDGAPLKIFAGGKTTAFFGYEDIPPKDINREPSVIVKSRGAIEFEYYDKPFSHKNEMWSYHSKDDNVNIKFVYYFLKTQEQYFQNIAGRMQMPQISIPDTEKLQIPIPPLEEQKRIVRILDKFDTLTTSLTEGLPKEIALREKQYAYYRDLLLDFKRIDNEP